MNSRRRRYFKYFLDELHKKSLKWSHCIGLYIYPRRYWYLRHGVEGSGSAHATSPYLRPRLSLLSIVIFHQFLQIKWIWSLFFSNYHWNKSCWGWSQESFVSVTRQSPTSWAPPVTPRCSTFCLNSMGTGLLAWGIDFLGIPLKQKLFVMAWTIFGMCLWTITYIMGTCRDSKMCNHLPELSGDWTF